MDLPSILTLYDSDERRDVVEPGMTREETANLVRQVDLKRRAGFITYSTLTAANADEAIAGECARARALGYQFEWKLFSYDRPADLGERLTAHGFEAADPEALLILDLAAYQPAPPISPEIDVRLATQRDLQDLVQVQNAVWEGDYARLADQLGNELRQAPDSLRIYIAYIDNRAAGTSWIRFNARGRFASLWGGSTLPFFRKRGIYSALLGARLRDARARGVAFVTIDASPMSRPIVERHGFRFAAVTTPYNWRPSGVS